MEEGKSYGEDIIGKKSFGGRNINFKFIFRRVYA